MMTERRLRRQRLVFYISRRIETSPRGIQSQPALTEYYEQLLAQLRAEFEHVHEMLAGIFAGQGARIIPSKDADHYRHYMTFLNPSLADRFDYDPIEGFTPQLSIQENCWHSEGNGQADFGFFMDGRYHSIIVLSRWPKATYPGIIHRLTSLRLLDYTITVNLDPLPVRREISKEEKEHDRIAGDYASEKKLSLLTVMEKKQRKIAALMQGHTIPFHVLFAVRAWDKSKEGLIAKTTAIKSAINGMNSAQYSESTLPSTSKRLFFETWPGWTWGNYRARKLYGENRYIADMLPVVSTFTGHLDTAEAIYEGPHQNLVGIKTFAGSTGNQSPQHAVLLGMSGAGKSVTICDLLSQTEGYFAYTVIIEEGLSYGIYTQTVEPDAKPIVIQPDGDITINYLDTQGLPITPDHLSAATALVARMVGFSQSEDKQMLRQAQIAKYINLLYEDVFQDWSRKNDHRMMIIARRASTLSRFRKEKMPPGATMLEAFADFRDWLESKEDEALAFERQCSEADVLRFLKDPATNKEVRNIAFACFRPDEYPTHRMLQELMSLDASGAFELGYIPDAAKELRAAAGFLITNHARKHIITLPRALRKRNVYEEVARFLDIPGGEEIVKESYAQLRKFNCWNISIVQQYARFKQSRIRSAVFGNSRQFYLMRQNDRADLEDIAHDIALPEITKHTIMNYSLPDHQTGQKHAAFTYLHVDAHRPICGTAHNIASDEMLYCSSSSGEHFEKRAKELRASANIIEGILTHSRKPELLETT